MFNKIAVYVSNISREVIAKGKNTEGMEMLQMVIIIAIAVAMAAMFYGLFAAYMPNFWGVLQQHVTSLFN